MNEWKNYHKAIGVIFIGTGIIFYPTPIPGTTILIILGFVWLIGKKRTLNFLHEVLNKKIFNFLKVKSIIKKL